MNIFICRLAQRELNTVYEKPEQKEIVQLNGKTCSDPTARLR